MESTSNPVYKYLHRIGGSNRFRMTVIIVLLPFLFVVVLAYAFLYLALLSLLTSKAKFLFDALKVLTVVSLGSMVFIPSLVLIVAALFTNRYIAPQYVNLVRITPIPAEQIVKGMIAGIAYHLRPLQIFNLGVLLSLISILPYWMGPVGLGIECVGSNCRPVIDVYTTKYGFLPPVIATLFLGLAQAYLYRLALSTGIWASLRWREAGLYVSGAIVFVSWALITPWAWLTIMTLWGRRSNPDWDKVFHLPLLCIIVFHLLDRITRFLARRVVEKIAV
jgi:hypothetical protein